MLTTEQHYTKAKLEVNIAMKRPQRPTIDGTAERKTLVKKRAYSCMLFWLFGHLFFSRSLSLYRTHGAVVSNMLLGTAPYQCVRMRTLQRNCVCKVPVMTFRMFHFVHSNRQLALFTLIHEQGRAPSPNHVTSTWNTRCMTHMIQHTILPCINRAFV